MRKDFTGHIGPNGHVHIYYLKTDKGPESATNMP